MILCRANKSFAGLLTGALPLRLGLRISLLLGLIALLGILGGVALRHLLRLGIALLRILRSIILGRLLLSIGLLLRLGIALLLGLIVLLVILLLGVCRLSILLLGIALRRLLLISLLRILGSIALGRLLLGLGIALLRLIILLTVLLLGVSLLSILLLGIRGLHIRLLIARIALLGIELRLLEQGLMNQLHAPPVDLFLQRAQGFLRFRLALILFQLGCQAVGIEYESNHQRADENGHIQSRRLLDVFCHIAQPGHAEGYLADHHIPVYQILIHYIVIIALCTITHNSRVVFIRNNLHNAVGGDGAPAVHLEGNNILNSQRIIGPDLLYIDQRSYRVGRLHRSGKHPRHLHATYTNAGNKKGKQNHEANHNRSNNLQNFHCLKIHGNPPALLSIRRPYLKLSWARKDLIPHPKPDFSSITHLLYRQFFSSSIFYRNFFEKFNGFAFYSSIFPPAYESIRDDAAEISRTL